MTDAADSDFEAILEAGRRAVSTEAEALWRLVASLDDSFALAVRAILATRGRVVVCGLGKSGHIAGKIAATLAATGTPALFLHASDAVHGDLGMLTATDTLLILSNSGDTREFGVIIRRAQHFGLPILAITSSEASAVGRAADIRLILPPAPEACPFGSSPSTSTTLMLALGDALALTAMRQRGTTAADLLALHPGGRLGLDLVRVDSFMHKRAKLPFVTPETPMDAVVTEISAKGFGIAAVVDRQERLAGVITDGDIRRAILAHRTPNRTTAADIMTRRPRTLESDAMARDALAIMTEQRITAVLVLDGVLSGKVIGLVHIHDLLRLGIA
ncbi:KpsF/GutQ family sugar-phosphate isomerase [Sphingomonas sp. H39-1-10]|uniref:KpsF/GutQ family sugar-phosphate isomerase n=1 Tax=Sphingomonas pollutisoli TaxID=3030829 RepID=UPI0023B90D4E|nr:KpsF/GutQ family sugar-phosphate isomerase [Sphingomonas pollutisoli]MDF0490364.1 KpsF/GutQ family sugar-phosphate isomerase [Sphingomonas pollutisoli]